MDSHDSANIASQISPACGHCEVFYGIQAVCVDHEVSVVLVDGWCLASIPTIEELGKRFLLEEMYCVHIEPGGVTGKDDLVGLGDKVGIGGGFEAGFCFLCLTI